MKTVLVNNIISHSTHSAFIFQIFIMVLFQQTNGSLNFASGRNAYTISDQNRPPPVLLNGIEIIYVHSICIRFVYGDTTLYEGGRPLNVTHSTQKAYVDSNCG